MGLSADRYGPIFAKVVEELRQQWIDEVERTAPFFEWLTRDLPRYDPTADGIPMRWAS